MKRAVVGTGVGVIEKVKGMGSLEKSEVSREVRREGEGVAAAWVQGWCVQRDKEGSKRGLRGKGVRKPGPRRMAAGLQHKWTITVKACPRFFLEERDEDWTLANASAYLQ